MITFTTKAQENSRHSDANRLHQKKTASAPDLQFADNRPEIITQRKFQAMADNSPRLMQLKAIQQMADNRMQTGSSARLPAMAGKRQNRPGTAQGQACGHEVMQGFFKYKRSPLSQDQIKSIKSFLKSKGEDDEAFEKMAESDQDEGAVTAYLKGIGIHQSVSSIIQNGSEAMDIDFGNYNSDDDGNISDGESINLYRANKDSTFSVKSHSAYSTMEQARISIREMRKGNSPSHSNPTLLKMGSQFFEFNPTPARKDFGISNMRATEDGNGFQRSGSPRTYAVLGADLDKSATRCGLTMSEMNDAVKILLYKNNHAGINDLNLKGMDQKCLEDLRELTSILILDIARSHNSRKVIETEFFGSTASFTSRLGGSSPEYGGAQNMKKHGMGGVAYLKNFDSDEKE